MGNCKGDLPRALQKPWGTCNTPSSLSTTQAILPSSTQTNTTILSNVNTTTSYPNPTSQTNSTNINTPTSSINPIKPKEEPKSNHHTKETYSSYNLHIPHNDDIQVDQSFCSPKHLFPCMESLIFNKEYTIFPQDCKFQSFFLSLKTLGCKIFCPWFSKKITNLSKKLLLFFFFFKKFQRTDV